MNLKSKISLLITGIILLNLYACNTFITTPTTTLPPLLLTSTHPAPMPTSTLLSITIIPSPLPIEPTISIFTPDPIQVEKWKEYETALAKTLLSFLPTEKVLCEWEILGQSAQEVYLWTVCAGLGVSGVSSAASVPVVVHVEVNGAVQSVEIPGDGTAYTRDILKMFPADVREKFEDYNSGRAGKMSEHIEWRRTHPEEPPLIVLSTTPTP